MAKRKIDAQTEVRIVALIARGDSYTKIQQALKEDGVDISLSAITDVKQRNELALDHIKSSLMANETSRATRILDKARKQVEDQLDAKENFTDKLAIIKRKKDDGDITQGEYESMVRVLESDATINIRDLITVSKEMFNQSQIESGKPTSITSDPEMIKRNVGKLLQAIKDNDTVGMLDAVFPDAD